MKNKMKHIVLMIVLGILLIALLCIQIISTIDKNLIFNTKIEKIDKCLVTYPYFNNQIDNTISSYIQKLDTKNITRVTFMVNTIYNHTNILFKEYKNKTIYNYKSFIFNRLNSDVGINGIVIPSELQNKIKLYIFNNNLKITDEELSVATYSYYLKNDELNIYISKYNENNDITFVNLNYNELKGNLIIKPAFDPSYTTMKTTTTTTTTTESMPKKIVAFTFDDGPSKYTTEIMNILDAYNAKATFFEVGYMIKNRSEITLDVHNRGYEIGNHTTDHSRLTKLKSNVILDKLNSNNDLYYGVTNDKMILVRPPYGAINQKVKDAIDSPIITWSLDTEDWSSRDAKVIVPKVQSEIQDGDVVLFHDLYPSTLEAITELVPYLYEQNYQIVSVSELFNLKGIPLENHHVYSKAR